MMSDDGFSSIPSTIRGFTQQPNPNPNPNPNPVKRKRNQPGTPDPDAEVISLSPKSLMATNRFVCEICKKGFQRDQNLQLHRRGHNLPWKLKQRTGKEVIRKKVYVCPEESCVHHHPSRALGDLTGIKKHFSRKHGEKKWKCDKCSKQYAVQSDWKAHVKICGTRDYRCECGTSFSRKDSFISHRAFCDALTEENARVTSFPTTNLTFRNDHLIGANTTYPQAAARNPQLPPVFGDHNVDVHKPTLPLWLDHTNSHLDYIGMPSNIPNPYLTSTLPELVQMAPPNMLGLPSQRLNRGQESSYNGGNLSLSALPGGLKVEQDDTSNFSDLYYNNQTQQEPLQAHMSATALLQKASEIGSTRSNSEIFGTRFGLMSSNVARHEASQVENMNELVINSMPDTSNENGLLLGDVNYSRTLLCDNTRSVNHMMMMKSSIGNREPNCDEAETSMTRDFLGVGGGGQPGRPLLQHELANFASIGSAMDLSQYYNGHH